jgi:hypothetical protein
MLGLSDQLSGGIDLGHNSPGWSKSSNNAMQAWCLGCVATLDMSVPHILVG